MNNYTAYQEWIVILEGEDGNMERIETWEQSSDMAVESALYETKMTRIKSVDAIPKDEYRKWMRQLQCQPIS
jgi:hypothetical protein